MTESMLVRTADGAWEELRPNTALPDGGVADLFGDDLGPVVGGPSPLLVVACQPQLPTGAPDAICVDLAGTPWIVQLAFDDAGCDLVLPRLLGFGGTLTGMSYDDFEAICDLRGSSSLAEHVASRADANLDRGAFAGAVTAALASGQLRLAAVVSRATPTLVQSMRFLAATGAKGSLHEVEAYASASVTAIRSSAVDLGLGLSQQGAVSPITAAAGAAAPVTSLARAASLAGGTSPAPAPVAAPTDAPEEADAAADHDEPSVPVTPAVAAAPEPEPAPAAAAEPAAAADADADSASAAELAQDVVDFLAAVRERCDDHTAELAGQLHAACVGGFDALVVEGDGEAATMHAQLLGRRSPDDAVSIIEAGTDGSVVLSFEALGQLEATWDTRDELCQGMERLLGTDLGDVRKISQLNLTIAEHLMDVTLVEAMADLVAGAVSALPAARAAA